jgi:hypothetical protein
MTSLSRRAAGPGVGRECDFDGGAVRFPPGPGWGFRLGFLGFSIVTPGSDARRARGRGTRAWTLRGEVLGPNSASLNGSRPREIPDPAEVVNPRA